MLILLSIFCFYLDGPGQDYEQTPKVMSFVLEKQRFVEAIKAQKASAEKNENPDFKIEMTSLVHADVSGHLASVLRVQATQFQFLLRDLFPEHFPNYKSARNNNRREFRLLEQGFLPSDFDILHNILIEQDKKYNEKITAQYQLINKKRAQIAHANNPVDQIKKTPEFSKEEISLDNYYKEQWADFIFSKLPIRLQRIIWVQLEELQLNSSSNRVINIGSIEENDIYLATELPKRKNEFEVKK